MRIPEKIKIGGLDYTVETVNEIDGDCVGKIYYQDLKIKVENSQPDFMALTFWHEILHAINGEMKETDIEFLAQALYQVIKDNPHMFKEGGDRKKNGRR